MQPAAPPVRVGRGRDGTLTYELDSGPEDLPPVRARDLEAAWDAARQVGPDDAAVGRAFCFGGTAGPLELTLSETARRWAAAVDRIAGLHTCRGVSLCLRLLAMVELAARAPVGVAPPPSLLHAVAAARLTASGQLDLEALPARSRRGIASGVTA
jgi:hypothetical protein